MTGLNGFESDIIQVSRMPVRQTNYQHSRDMSDTLSYSNYWGGQFIMSPGDAMMIVYQMPADGIIKGVNVPVYEWGTGDQELTVSLHAVSYPFREDSTLYPSDIVDGAGWIGGYDMDDSTGWMSISGTTYSPGGTVGICDSNDVVATGAQDPLGYEEGVGTAVSTMGLVWPDSFNAATIDPTNNPAQQDNWINTADYGSEPAFSSGEWVGILVASTGAGGGDDPATGFYYADGTGEVDPWVFAKFYSGCSGTSGNGGWHIRHWVIDFELAVSFPTNPLPYSSVCPLPTTLTTDDRIACVHLIDDNPTGGPAGIVSATFHYALDSLTAVWNNISATLTEGTPTDGTWECTVPGQPPGTTVYWYFTFIDTFGNTGSTPIYSYATFQPIEPNLFFYNANDYGPFIAGYYLYGSNLPYDFWGTTNYEEPTEDLFNSYDLIIEVTGSGPVSINDDAIAQYLAAGQGDYILTGDEWLDLGCYPPPGDTLLPGYFAYDFLGIHVPHFDINYQTPGDEYGISRLLTVEGDPISGDLYSFLDDSLDLNYDPNYELGVHNFLDGVDPLPTTNVAFYGVSGILDSLGNPTGLDTFATGIYLTHGSGSQVVFMAFDPLATNTGQPNTWLHYYWIGIQSIGPLPKAIEWIVNQVAVYENNNSQLPEAFNLSQNYPNPFNTSTRFKISIPREEQVRLAIYDLLGREVAVLVDEALLPGVKELNWDASQIASGIYFYRLEIPGRIFTRKMAVVK